MYLYFVPLFAQKFGATFLQLGFIGTASALTYVVATIIVGHFADRVSHIWLYAFALFVNVVGTAVLLLSRSVSDIVLLRAFGGVGLSFLWPAAEVLVVDLASEGNRVKEMGTYSVVWGIGFLIGPTVGGTVIPTFGFTNLFLISSILILIGFVQALVGVTPHAKPRERTQATGPAFTFSGLISSTRKLWSWYLLIAIYAMIFAVVTTIFPGYAYSVGVTVELIGVLFTIFGLSRIAIFATIQHYVRLGEARVLTVVSLAICAAIAIIALIPQFFVFLPAIIILGMSFAVIFPISITLISRSFTSERMGIAIGSYESVYGLGAAIGPVFAGTIAAISTVRESFLAVALLGLLMAGTAQLRKP